MNPKLFDRFIRYTNYALSPKPAKKSFTLMHMIIWMTTIALMLFICTAVSSR